MHALKLARQSGWLLPRTWQNPRTWASLIVAVPSCDSEGTTESGRRPEEEGIRIVANQSLWTRYWSVTPPPG